MSSTMWQQGEQAFWGQKVACSPDSNPWLQPPSKTRFLRFLGNWNYRECTRPGTAVSGPPPSSVLLEHFLLVGGNKMAADVSNVKGNLCWCHGQGITSAYSYRMYHLQRIPSTTYSKNPKKALNSWLNSIYIFHPVFFFFFTPVVFHQSPLWRAIKRKPFVYKQ